MDILLTAINSKYIHSNLAVYSLKAYYQKCHPDNKCNVIIAEYTINQYADDILMDIYKKNLILLLFHAIYGMWN